MVVRCLAFAVVQAETMARGNAGALYLTGAASYALTHPVRFWLSLLRAVRRSVERYRMMTLELSVGQSVAGALGRY